MQVFKGEKIHNERSKITEKTMSPLLSFFLTAILPMIVFIAIGKYMGGKRMKQLGGKDSLSFGMGKSNA